jgi:hypothetical protein
MADKPNDDFTNVVPIKTGNKPAPDKLTGKQTLFVQGILKGLSQSDAYRGAYNCTNMADNSVWREASVLFANPKVSARIKAGQRRQEEAAVHTGLSLRHHVERELYALSTKADTDQARLRALELLGKTEKCGIFVERTADVTETMTPEELQVELETKLKAAFEKLA